VLSPDDPEFLAVRDRVRALFFDLDGTLIDTDDALLETVASRLERWSYAFGGRDPRPLLRRILIAAEGPVNGIISILDALGLDDILLSVGDRLRRLRGERPRGDFLLVDGVLEAMRSLSPSYRLGLVTSRSRTDALAFLRQCELENLLEVLATREDPRRLKPHPQPVQHAADSCGLSPDQCVLVGDTPVDIVSAKKAGAYAVGVLCGFGERDELLEAGADLILENTSQLTAWF
jgi:phosphoglycolate phosphatase-like HAD superfamily hydrolase